MSNVSRHYSHNRNGDNHTMRKFLTLAAIFVAFQAYAVPASQESVENLLTVMKTESMMESMYGSVEQMMRQGMKQSVQGKPLTAEQQRFFDSVPTKFVAVMRQEFNWEKIKSMYVQLYRDTFEQNEVDDLITFYASPAGQAFVNKMPVVMQKSLALTQSLMQSLMPKMTAAINDAMAEPKLSKQR
jgi:uncharacterized protein